MSLAVLSPEAQPSKPRARASEDSGCIARKFTRSRFGLPWLFRTPRLRASARRIRRPLSHEHNTNGRRARFGESLAFLAGDKS